MTIISELVLVDDGEPVLLDAEDLVVGLVWIVELIRELGADPTSYSESVQPLKMTIFSDLSIPELVLPDAGEPLLIVTLL